MAMKISVSLLKKVQSYCDERCYTSSFGFDDVSGNWDDSTDDGLIGQELSVISSSIERIFEILDK